MKIPVDAIQAAIAAFEEQKRLADVRIAELRELLLGTEDVKPRQKPGPKSKRAKIAVDPAKPAKKKRSMSAAARKRIAAAQKKRWADYHAQNDK